MESEGQILDEAGLESAIADLLSEGAEEPRQHHAAETAARSEQVFPDLSAQDEIDEKKARHENGFAASLLQKWAGLRGAA